jgi:hypothetical protein
MLPGIASHFGHGEDRQGETKGQRETVQERLLRCNHEHDGNRAGVVQDAFGVIEPRCDIAA